MGTGTATLDRIAPIDLAREIDFALGEVRVHPSTAEVSAQGERIRLQPRVMQVLVALVRAKGEVVSRDDLVASCWGGLAIGEDAIQRCIARLRRLSETEVPGAFTIETLPRIGYRLSRGEVAREVAPSDTQRWLTPQWIGLGALLAAVVTAGAWIAAGTPGWPSGETSVAVMPLDTPPGDTFAHELADGIADEVASSLAKSDLVSLPASSAGPLSGVARDALARRLGAAYTLSGRIQRVGGALAVTVSIDEAYQHERLWSANFNRDAGAAQDLQQEVAAHVAGVLHCALAATNPGGSRLDGETLRLYLRACEDIDSNPDDTQARDVFRAVVARQPRFASAWANFALASAIASADLTGDQAAAAVAEAREAAHRALLLDPKAGLAYAALESLVPAADLAQRQSLILKGLTVAPDNARLNYREGVILSEVGRVRDQIGYTRRAVALDPLNPFFAEELASALAQHGSLVEGRAMLDRDARIWPSNNAILAARIGVEARYGDPALSLQRLNDPNARPAGMTDAELADWRDFALVRQSGDKSKIAAYSAQVLANLGGKRLTVAQALVRLASLGATDATFLAAAQATPDNPVETEPFFRSPAAAVRADPRFLPLMAKTGVLAFWRASGRRADFCDAADRPYDCHVAATRLGPQSGTVSAARPG